MKIKFNDKITMSKKKVISCRDGVQEYYGQELGLEPASKIFKVYRSPETIKKIKDAMHNLPIIHEHVEPVGDVNKSIIGGTIKSSQISIKDSITVLEHDVELDKRFLDIIKSGKIEVSLGYTADVVDHDTYDLEQVNITPHHLAIVKAGRCGDTCKFKDKRNMMEELNKAWNALSDEDKQAFLAKHGGKNKPVTDSQEFKDAMTVAFADAKTDFEKKLGEVKVKLSDEAKKAIKDETLKEHEARIKIVGKAKEILGSDYKDDGKDVKTIMTDALAKEYKDVKFEDGEIAGAFKALQVTKKQVEAYKQFGDQAKNNVWDEAQDKEI